MTRSHPARPRSTQALETLRRQIRERRFANGAVLPGERDLALDLGVSRSTLRNALATLVTEGVLAQRRGFGTVVVSDTGLPDAGERRGRPVGAIMGLGDELLARNERLTIKEDTIGTFMALPDESLTFRIGGHAKVCRVRRTFYENGGDLFAVERVSIPLDLIGRQAPLGQWTALVHAGELQPDCITRRVRAARFNETPDADTSDRTNGVITEQYLYNTARACLIAWQLWQPCAKIDLIASWPVEATRGG